MYLDVASTAYHMNMNIWKDCTILAEQGIGNPSSLHSVGVKAKAIIEDARTKIAESIGAKPHQIIFFPSATAANNAVLNFTEWDTPPIEHASMNKPNASINKSHILMSNITGELFDIKSIPRMTHYNMGYLHSDASAAYSKVDINVEELGLDFLTFPSSHKLGLMGGCCPLFVKEPFLFSTKLSKLSVGGGQERGAYRGTENVLAIYSYGRYAESANKKVQENKTFNNDINHRIDKKIEKYNGEIIRCRFSGNVFSVIGDSNIALVAFRNVDAETLQYLLNETEDIQVSTLSACSSGKVDNRIIRALHLPTSYNYGTIRISWDTHYSADEICDAIDKIFDVGYNLGQMKI